MPVELFVIMEKMQALGFGRGARKRPDGLYVLSEGNGRGGLGSTMKDKVGEGVPATGRVQFDPKLFSTPRGVGAPENITRYEQEMSLTIDGGRMNGNENYGLEKRQQVLEEAFGSLQGMVDGLGTDLGDLRNVVGTLKGDMTRTYGSIKNEIGSLQTNMTTQLGDLTRMISGLFCANKTELSQVPNASIGIHSQSISSSQGSPWVPGQATHGVVGNKMDNTVPRDPWRVSNLVGSVSDSGQVSTHSQGLSTEMPRAYTSSQPIASNLGSISGGSMSLDSVPSGFGGNECITSHPTLGVMGQVSGCMGGPLCRWP